MRWLQIFAHGLDRSSYATGHLQEAFSQFLDECVDRLNVPLGGKRRARAKLFSLERTQSSGVTLHVERLRSQPTLEKSGTGAGWPRSARPRYSPPAFRG